MLYSIELRGRWSAKIENSKDSNQSNEKVRPADAEIGPASLHPADVTGSPARQALWCPCSDRQVRASYADSDCRRTMSSRKGRWLRKPEDSFSCRWFWLFENAMGTDTGPHDVTIKLEKFLNKTTARTPPSPHTSEDPAGRIGRPWRRCAPPPAARTRGCRCPGTPPRPSATGG